MSNGPPLPALLCRPSTSLGSTGETCSSTPRAQSVGRARKAPHRGEQHPIASPSHGRKTPRQNKHGIPADRWQAFGGPGLPATGLWAKLALEIEELSQEWNAYDGGRCSRRATLEANAGGTPPPKGPLRTASAVSLLIRVVRALPGDLPLRAMIEPLVHELLEAVYSDWVPMVAFSECEEKDFAVERLLALLPFYATTTGLHAQAQESAAKAANTAAELQALKDRCAPLQEELREAALATENALGQLAEEQRQKRAVEDQLAKSEEALARLKNQTRLALSEFAEVQFREQGARADLRNMLRDRQEKANTISELQAQLSALTHIRQELEGEVHEARSSLQQREAEIRQLPKLREQLSVYEKQECIQGLGFAARIAREVFNSSLEELCGPPASRLPSSSDITRRKEAKAALEVLCRRLKEMRTEGQELRVQVQQLRAEVRETRQLVPVWNADTVQDLREACEEGMALTHRRLFSHKDQRAFAGLGLGAEVPPYLRAEGIVRHVFVPKHELKDVMASFLEHIFSEDRSCAETSPEVLHGELHQHLKKRHEGETLVEFAYALVCGLDVHRDDPDFELFDLMMSGAVHPSIVKDQQRMLRELQNLVRSCQEAQVEDSAFGSRGHGRSTSTTLQQREQVSTRMLRAVLQAVFPEKTAARQNSLRRATYATIQTLMERARTPSADIAFISDLFATNTDGGQSTLVDELRRQHYHEVVEFTAELVRRLQSEGQERKPRQDGTSEPSVDVEGVRRVLRGLDPHMRPKQVEELVLLACPEAEACVSVLEAGRNLRQGALLRPERLWLRAQPQDVVEALLRPPASQEQLSTVLQGEHPHSHLRPPRRSRVLKVLENPLAKLRSDAYDSPEGLEAALMPEEPQQETE